MEQLRYSEKQAENVATVGVKGMGKSGAMQPQSGRSSHADWVDRWTFETAVAELRLSPVDVVGLTVRSREYSGRPTNVPMSGGEGRVCFSF